RFRFVVSFVLLAGSIPEKPEPLHQKRLAPAQVGADEAVGHERLEVGDAREARALEVLRLEPEAGQGGIDLRGPVADGPARLEAEPVADFLERDAVRAGVRAQVGTAG